jgi:hypothetical protein
MRRDDCGRFFRRIDQNDLNSARFCSTLSYGFDLSVATLGRQALDELARTPTSNPSLLQAAVFQLWHNAIPSRLATHRAVVDDVLRFVSEAVHQTCRVLQERDRAHDGRDADQLKSLYGVIDESVAHVYFCLSRDHGRDGDATPEARREFFSLVAPIPDEIPDFGLERGFVLAPTVHQNC